MHAVLLVIHLIIAIALVGFVLIQRSEGGGLGIGGGPGGLVSARGAANFLTRTTAILAGCFFLTSIALTLIAQRDTSRTSIMDKPAAAAPAETPAPALPEVPLSQ